MYVCVRTDWSSDNDWLMRAVFTVVGGTNPGDAYEVALLNGCGLQDGSQFVQMSQQQPQQLAVLYNNSVLPIS